MEKQNQFSNNSFGKTRKNKIIQVQIHCLFKLLYLKIELTKNKQNNTKTMWICILLIYLLHFSKIQKISVKVTKMLSCHPTN